MQMGIRGETVAAAAPQRIGKYRFSVEAAVSAAKTIDSQAARLPPQISRDTSIIWAFGNSLRIGPSSPGEFSTGPAFSGEAYPPDKSSRLRTA